LKYSHHKFDSYLTQSGHATEHQHIPIAQTYEIVVGERQHLLLLRQIAPFRTSVHNSTFLQINLINFIISFSVALVPSIDADIGQTERFTARCVVTILCCTVHHRTGDAFVPDVIYQG
jgi:hypothetical protein